jgi:hypothetical protein
MLAILAKRIKLSVCSPGKDTASEISKYIVAPV